MSNQNNSVGEKITHRIGSLVLNGLMAAAVIFFLIACAVFVQSRKDAKNPAYSLSTLQYDVREGRYYNLSRKANINRVNGVGVGNNQYEECYAAGDYFYAAAVSRMYEETGDAELAAYYRAKMESAKAKMGLYTAEADRIDGMLETFINKN